MLSFMLLNVVIDVNLLLDSSIKLCCYELESRTGPTGAYIGYNGNSRSSSLPLDRQQDLLVRDRREGGTKVHLCFIG
jgi:hypothetical protein